MMGGTTAKLFSLAIVVILVALLWYSMRQRSAGHLR